ncbi:MAG: hypothetical protein KGN84_18315 [Acidobacteriota bacterium]|nr:hypothetical protein [Acidobacteriota bacterium]
MTAIRLLLASAIDYAGMFPPAGLSLDKAVRNYRSYRDGPQSWALGRFVAPAVCARETGLEPDALSLASGHLEHAGEIVYFESATADLTAVRRKNARAKIRTGGLDASRFPSTDAVAALIGECSRLRLPFKATAGLHHAIRGVYPVSYEPDSAMATMHGFLNVLLAGCFAWHGGPVAPVLEEQDGGAFRISGDSIRWRDFALATGHIGEARRDFTIAFGSCSFEEPIQELCQMGLL